MNIQARTHYQIDASVETVQGAVGVGFHRGGVNEHGHEHDNVQITLKRMINEEEREIPN